LQDSRAKLKAAKKKGSGKPRSQGLGGREEIYKKSVEIKISFVADNEQGARLLESHCFR